MVGENKELIRKLLKGSEIVEQKEQEIIDGEKKLKETLERYEKSNKMLIWEIERMSEEMRNCKKCEEMEECVTKYKEEVDFYRNQSDKLAAQLSRAQVQIRRNNK